MTERDRTAVSDTVHFPALITMIGMTFRILIALHPYSGEGNPPMYGDYEAQRHWMEVTTNLPMDEWYRNTTSNPLQYWGLDYPPLTALQSWLCGILASRVQPGLVQLHDSWGYETPGARALMRLTVLLGDVLFFFSALWQFCAMYYDTRPNAPRTMWGATRLFWSRHHEAQPRVQRGRRAGMVPTSLCSEVFLLALLQPGLVLIDHGHFQYNSIGLGLALWAVVLIMHGRHLAGSIAFCLSLNFKQIALYYAPAFFFYLLSCAIHDSRGSIARALARVALLGVVVLATFAAIWAPFCVAGATGLSGPREMSSAALAWARGAGVERSTAIDFDAGGCVEGLLHVLQRLFPFERGLFEDKVANIWCSLSVVIKMRQRFSRPTLTALSVAGTTALLAPSAVGLLRRRPTTQRLLLALFTSSLAFFLFGFQVHEKSILYPLLPMTLLLGESPGPACWFNVLAVFSMLPLLARDQLRVATAVGMLLFVVCSIYVFGEELLSVRVPRLLATSRVASRVVWLAPLRLFFAAAVPTMFALVVAWGMVPPPARYPDLWVVVIEVYSCAHLCLVCAWANWRLWATPDRDDVAHDHTPPPAVFMLFSLPPGAAAAAAADASASDCKLGKSHDD